MPYFWPMKKWYGLPAAALAIFMIGCNGDGEQNSSGNGTTTPPVPTINYAIAGTQPHDTSYFTEGLEFYNNTLLESTGLKGRSRLVRMDPETSKPLQEIRLDDQYFGEGLTVLNDTLYQLTWQEHKVLVYSARDFRKIKELPLTGDGWGLTNDGKHLIASNGSSDLFFYEPSGFKLVKTLNVTENGNAVININELEYVNGFIYANQWQLNDIVKINAATGEVVAKMNFKPYVDMEEAKNPQANELNGIAYNPANKRFYITGKNWSQIYQLQFEH